VQISGVLFAVTDWSQVERVEHKGESGIAYWRTREFSGIRVRMVEYTPGYLANHWCAKGHVLLCIEGQLETELKDGRKFTLTPGMSYHGDYQYTVRCAGKNTNCPAEAHSRTEKTDERR
jgi:hypothetical protein